MRSTRHMGPLALITAAALLAVTGCGDGFSDSSDTEQESGSISLEILIGSSGDAETEAVQAAASAWAEETGNSATVTPAQDLEQQLGQAFAGDDPPDVFYVDAAKFADYVSVGALEPYGDQLGNASDFYESLTAAFTDDGEFYCAPKDFSTLALEINTELWAQAGLTTEDIPTTWEELTTAATTLKNAGITPLVIGDTRDRIGAFMVQAGGWVVSADGTTATADSSENLTALTYLRDLLTEGLAVYPSEVDAGWGGEAFGKGLTAMTIEGNWIKGSMSSDYPDIEYTVNPLPAGPSGEGTLSFTTCWGIAAKSAHKSQAISFVEAMTSTDQQMTFASAFGVMPSVASAREQYIEEFAEDAAFLDGAEYAQGPVNAAKMDSVLSDFDAALQSLTSTDPETILQTLQQNTEAVLAD